MNSEESIVVIDKPKGITSFDVIRRLRREYTERGEKAPKMGHAGTLDPLASGLMIIGVGEGTKKLNEYLKLPKTYLADILVGESRTTGDLEGEVVAEKKCDELDRSLVEQTLQGMVGVLELPVPAYSAIKQGGVPLYKKARRGETVQTPIKSMTINSVRLHSVEQHAERCLLQIEFAVGSGTYIRSLAEELGRRLDYPATLAGLRRTKVGEFDITKARTI